MDRIDNLYEKAYEKWNILGDVVETEDTDLKKMSDQELVSAIADYPYLVDIYAYDSIGEGIDKLAENCDAYAELISRESGKRNPHIIILWLQNGCKKLKKLKTT